MQNMEQLKHGFNQIGGKIEALSSVEVQHQAPGLWWESDFCLKFKIEGLSFRPWW